MAEKESLVRNQHQHGVLKLPPGFRFHPTDEELVVQYLKRKIFSCPLPASIIPEIDLGKQDPWDLPGGCEQESYFFSLRDQAKYYPNRSNRAAGSGYWKATGKEKPIVGSRCNQVVGMKKALVFYKGKPSKGSRTDWIMHEYRLAGGPETSPCVFPQRKNSTHCGIVPTRDWVLCRIFKKKRAAAEMDAEAGECHEECRPSSPSSSHTSCVTELSDGSSNGEDISSCP